MSTAPGVVQIHLDSTFLGSSFLPLPEGIDFIRLAKEAGFAVVVVTDLDDEKAAAVHDSIRAHGIEPDVFTNARPTLKAAFVIDGRNLCECYADGFPGFSFAAMALVSLAEALAERDAEQGDINLAQPLQ